MPTPNLTLLELSPEDLDRLAPITENDIVIADRAIVKASDREFVNLRLAEAVLENDPFEEA